MESTNPCPSCSATPAGCEIRWFLSGRRCCDTCLGEHHRAPAEADQ